MINKKLLKKIILFIAIVIVFLFLLFMLRSNEEALSKADSQYRKGEMAATIAERQKSFNEALDLYLSLENEYNPKFGTGRLYFNIANTYFQLDEIPRALLFYERANALRPRDHRVQRNMDIARKKLGIPPKDDVAPFEKVFFFHNYLSLPERLQLFFGLSLLCFILASVFLWTKRLLYYRLAVGTSIVVLLMMLSLGYTHYFSSVEGILIRSIDLRRDAGNQYAKVGGEPISAGTKVEILDIRPDGQWLKVLAPNGDLGYVPQESIGLIN